MLHIVGNPEDEFSPVATQIITSGSSLLNKCSQPPKKQFNNNSIRLYEPPHGKTNNLHRRKQRRRSASR